MLKHKLDDFAGEKTPCLILFAVQQQLFYSGFMPLGNYMRRCGWLFLLLSVCGTSLVGAQESPPKIIFLHLKLDDHQVSLVSSSMVPGTLKRSSENRPALELEVATSAGQVLWTNKVAAPSIRHFEYEDPENPGQIISKVVQLTNTEFSVRIPAFKDAHHVNFYLAQASTATNAPSANRSINALPESPRQILGTVVLPHSAK